MVEDYGVTAVLGQHILSARTARDFRIATNVELFYMTREHAMKNDLKEWDSFLERYTETADGKKIPIAVLEWAEQEYTEYLDG